MRDWNIRNNKRLIWNLMRHLGVIFDSELHIKLQINTTACARFFFPSEKAVITAKCSD